MLLGLTYQFVRFIIDLVLVRTRSDTQLRAEVLALRHQLRVLERKHRPAMSLKEVTPGESCSAWCGRDAVAAEQVADAGRGDLMAEFEQLDANVPQLITPERVLPGQLQHQLPALGGKLRSAGTGVG